MNRADLAWALTATLPHVGTTKGPTLGFESRNGSVYLYACDGYTTAGISRIDGPTGWAFHMAKGEAKDLLMFVRPSRVAHNAEVLSHAVRGAELHIGTDDDSAVFELAEPTMQLDGLLDLLGLWDRKPVQLSTVVQSPKLLERFSKAQRVEGDRLRWYPHRTDSGTAALVLVGSDFVGALAGMSDDEQGESTVSSFLQNAGNNPIRSVA